MTDSAAVCRCRVCLQGERVAAIKAKLPPDDAAYLDTIMLDLMHAESDAVYWQMVHKGTWPGIANGDLPR